MTHEELRDRLLDLVYGELSPPDARAVEEHAAGCEACRAELAALRGTRQVMSALPVEPAPERGERVLVAAAREAVRGRAPGRGWARWLWAAPVLAASLAAVVAISVRVGAPPPPSAAHEDPDALRGEPSPYAQAPAAAPAEPPALAPPRGAGLAEGARPALEVPRLTMRRAAPPRDEEAGPSRNEEAGPSRFATPPPGHALALADRAPAAPPPAVASAPPPPAPLAGAAPARPSAAPPRALGAPAAPAPSAPAPGEVGAGAGSVAGSAAAAGGAAQDGLAAEAEAKREAAPAPARRAKAVAAPQAVREAVAPRERALAAARARASVLGVDTGGMTVDLGVAAVGWDEWRAAAGPGAAPPAALNGRRFWPVVFRAPAGRPGGALTVFVEDGTFRPLAELREE